MPKPVVLEMETFINARPEIIWDYLVDWERLDRWMTEASNFRVISPHREGVGVIAEATIRIGFMKTIDRIRVTRWDPPQVLGLEHLGWVKGEGVMKLSARDLDGSPTRLHWRETLIPPWGAAGTAGIRMWKPLMRRVFLRDLRLLKTLVEPDLRG